MNDMNDIDEIKDKINTIIKNENLIYCDVCYDGENENEQGIWFYDLIVYDKAEKINQLITKLNKYAKTVVYKNIDDGDYTIECTINTRR